MKHIEDGYPLSPMQQGMLFHNMSGVHSGVDIEQVVVELPESLNLSALEHAWQRVAQRHELIRTAFRWSPSAEPIHEIHRDVTVSVHSADWRDVPEAEREQAFDEWLATDRRRGFEIALPPLMRVSLFRFGKTNYRMVWTFHHLLFDARSIVIVLKDVFDFYEAFSQSQEIDLQGAQPFRDHIAFLKTRDASHAKDFWRETLRGFSTPTPLVVAHSPTNCPTGFKVAETVVSEKVTLQLKALVVANELTLNSVIQGVWALLLSRYSGESDVLFGAVRAGRKSSVEGADAIAGMFINTVPVRAQVDASAQVLPWLKDLRKAWIAMRPFEHTSLSDIQSCSDVPRDTPLFETFVNFSDQPWDASLHALGGKWAQRRMTRRSQPNYPLALDASAGDALRFTLLYDTRRFDAQTIERMLGHLKMLLTGIAENPASKLGDLPLLTDAERHQLLTEWNNTAAPYDKSKCVSQLIEEQASRTPDALAVADDHHQLTYAGLEQKANCLAHHLIKSGAGKGNVVAVCMERSAEMAVALLGVLKTGAAYLPLDPAHPIERLSFVIRDAKAIAVITDAGLKGKTQLEENGFRTVCVDDIVKEAQLERPVLNVPPLSPTDLAYIIYTSGSTGTPKGVQIEHGGLLNLITWHQRTYEVTQADRATQLANPAFDASVWELWPYLTAGASIHIPNEETARMPQKLIAWLATQRISITFLPTPLAEATFEESWPETTLRAVLTGGDKLHRPPPANYPCSLFNHYGPTENTVVTTWMEIPPAGSTTPPIGKPISNTQVYVLASDQRPMPVGVPGELYIGGDSLARGYLNQPSLTDEKFIKNPFSNSESSPLYRSGDLVRWLPDGTLEFLGRRDGQVKVRGHRIELGEIESLLNQNSLVREAAVVINQARLVAHVVLRDKSDHAVRALRDNLQRKLPSYMLPEQFEFLDALPLTPNGKVDRQALENRELTLEGNDGFVAPRNTVEKQLTEVWSEVLGVERISVRDDFFRIGGHSLLAAKMISRVRSAFKHELPLRDLFESPTIEGLAKRIETAVSSSGGRPGNENGLPIPRVMRNGHVPLSFAQERLWFLEQLHPDIASNNIPFVFSLNGRLSVSALEKSLQEIVRRHDPLRTIIKNQNGQPVAIRHSNVGFALAVEDLTGSENERETTAWEIIGKEAARPFDLTQSPLLRAKLFQLSETKHLLLLVTHHIACDGWSMEILSRELQSLYDSQASNRFLSFPDLPITYGDFADWQRQSMQGKDSQGALGYWKEQLAGAPTLEFPTDRPRPAVQTYRGAVLPLKMSASLSNQVVDLSRRQGVTPYVLLLAAFQTLVHRYSGQSDFVIGSPTAGRLHGDTEGLVGLFLNMLCLRANAAGDPTFAEFVNRTRDTVFGALAHQTVPFEKIAEELHSERDMSRSPLFQMMFVLQNAPTETLRLSGLEVTTIPVHTGTAKFDLTVSLEQRAEGFDGYIEYNTDLLDESTISRLAQNFQTLLEGIVADPAQRLSRLPLLAETEEFQLLETWNDTQVEFPQGKCIHELFGDQVAHTPDAVAVVFGEDQLTYRELDEKANLVARRLQALGVRSDERVGICVERSLEMMIGLLGILKSGGCYVPLDPTYPADRLAFMLDDSGAQVLLTFDSLSGAGRFSGFKGNVVCLDSLAENCDEAPLRCNHPVISSENLAYVIYTSGSTGQPKGVMVTHRNVVNFFTAMDRILGTDPGVWLAVTSISFDISVLELFWTLVRGFKVVIQPDQNQQLPATVETSGKKTDFSLFYFASDARGDKDDRYRLLIEGAKFADANGFEAVWTPERHFHPFGGIYPNPAVTGAAIAMATKRVQIRAGSIVLPLHHPVRVAEEWSIVDNLSKGRTGLSIASGWHADDFAIAPENYAHRKEIMCRNAELIRKLWRGEAVSLPDGEGEPVKIELFPKPVQSDLPMWLTSSGNAATFQLAGQLGLNVLTHLCGQSMEQLASKIALYRQTWKQHLHSDRTGRVSLMLHTFVWDDAKAVHEIVRGPLREYLRVYRDLSQKIVLSCASGVSPARKDASAADLEVMLDEAAERYFEDCGLFGTPQTCAGMIGKLRDIGVDEIACLIDFGVSPDVVLKSLQFLNELRKQCNGIGRRKPSAVPVIPSVAEQILKYGVTHFQCTPSLASTLVVSRESREALGKLRKCLIGGEALPVPLARQVREAVRGDFFNMYGPTETTVWSAYHNLREIEESVPIGRPIANTAIHVLDSNLQLAPIGVAGELFIGGAGVTRGYLNRPELSQGKFIPNPHGSESDSRLYRTGDRARYRADGTIEFLGRLDHQVKLRGHRIELGEIESLIRQHPSVRECVVCSREDSPGDARLVAYVVPAKAGEKLDAELLEALRAKLPAYMLPSSFVTLDKLPLTPNGKINRKALPVPERPASKANGGPLPPQTRIEREIAKIWQELLKLEHVGLNDNFFDLGGHSLLVVKAQAKLEEKFGIRLPVVQLFQHPTVSTLAKCFGERPTEQWSKKIYDRAQRQSRAMFGQPEVEVLA